MKHPTDWYECLKCRKRGPNVRDQPCSFQECPKHDSPDDTVTTKKVETETLEADNEESLLEALLEEELVLSQMLEEALALSAAEATTGTTQQTNTEEEEMLKEAMALSMQPQKNQEQERKEKDVEGNQVVATSEVEEDEENLEQAIALSLQEPRNDSHEPSARPEAADHADGRGLVSDLSSEKNRYNMQCLVNMGFSKVQAVWGVKRANEGNGSIDLALQHASWRCDAELLMEKRRKLSHMTMEPPKTSQALCITLSFSRIECMHQYFAYDNSFAIPYFLLKLRGLPKASIKWRLCQWISRWSLRKMFQRFQWFLPSIIKTLRTLILRFCRHQPCFWMKLLPLTWGKITNQKSVQESKTQI